MRSRYDVPIDGPGTVQMHSTIDWRIDEEQITERLLEALKYMLAHPDIEVVDLKDHINERTSGGRRRRRPRDRPRDTNSGPGPQEQ